MKSEDVNRLLENLQQEWPIVEIVSFNEFNIQEKIENLPYQLIRFNEQFIKEKAQLNELLYLKTRYECKLYDELKFNSEKSLTKYEIEQYYLPNNPKVVKLNSAIDKQRIIVDYFETCTKTLEKMNWNMKLYIDERRFSA